MNARIHALSPDFLEQIFSSLDDGAARKAEPVQHASSHANAAWHMPLNPVPNLLECDLQSFTCGTKDPRAGITLEFSIVGLPDEGEVLFDSRNAEDAGILLRAVSRERIEVVQRPQRWPNRYFTELGLFCLLEAKVTEIISLRHGANH